jgi:hypothetical protein
MSKQALGGIQNVLDGLLSPRNPPSLSLGVEGKQPITEPSPVIKKEETGDRPPQHSGARRGRPLGKSKAGGQPKSKVTLWLSQALVDSYRDWSWEARCQFSHLVERAMADYLHRK